MKPHEKAWILAVSDAGLQDQGVRFYPFAARPREDGVTAMFWDPASMCDPTGQTGPPLSDSQRDDLNAHVGEYRVAAYIEIPLVALTGKLRHELEHVRQHRHAGRRIFEISRAVHVLQSRAFGRRRGTGYLSNLEPSEYDANRASATLVRSTFEAGECDAILPTDEAVLVRPGAPPESVESLGLRQLAFASLYSEALEVALREEIHDTIEGFFGSVCEGATKRWQVLTRDDELRVLAEQAIDAAPSEDMIEAGGWDVGHLWQNTRELTTRAADRARHLLGLEPLDSPSV